MSTIPQDWIVPRRIVHESGERGAALAEIQLVCDAGPFALDLMVREQAAPAGLEFVGQVMRSENLELPVADLSLALVAAPDAAAAAPDTATDEFGEFDLHSLQKATSLGLRLGSEADAPCVLVWATT